MMQGRQHRGMRVSSRSLFDAGNNLSALDNITRESSNQLKLLGGLTSNYSLDALDALDEEAAKEAGASGSLSSGLAVAQVDTGLHDAGAEDAAGKKFAGGAAAKQHQLENATKRAEMKVVGLLHEEGRQTQPFAETLVSPLLDVLNQAAHM